MAIQLYLRIDDPKLRFLYYMKSSLLTTAYHDTMFNLGCDYGLCFLNTLEARIVKKTCHRPKTLAPIKGWFVGRVSRMHIKFGNYRVDYKNPIDWMDRPSNMEIGLCWYQNETNNKWTCVLTNLLIVDIKK